MKMFVFLMLVYGAGYESAQGSNWFWVWSIGAAICGAVFDIRPKRK